jgi:phage gpG-like protein
MISIGMSADASGIMADLGAMGNGPTDEAKRDIGGIYLDFVKRRFASGGDGTWEALKGGTLKDRERKGFASGSTLIRTGSLERSFSVGDPNNVCVPTGDGVIVGSTLPQSVPLHFGWPERNIPARPILVDPDAETSRLIGVRVTEWADEVTG